MQLRKLILKIHLYSGLICFWYLIILGVSSLHFNHQFSFMKGDGGTSRWAQSIQLSNNFPDDLKLSEAIRDSLSLIGWPLPWETWHDSTGVFHFALEQPGKRYVIDYAFTDHKAEVSETAKSFWQVFNSLHGGGSVPNAPFMTFWKWYARTAVVLVVLSVALGIFLWYRGNRDRKTGWYLLISSLLVSIGWMLQLYFIG